MITNGNTRSVKGNRGWQAIGITRHFVSATITRCVPHKKKRKAHAFMDLIFSLLKRVLQKRNSESGKTVQNSTHTCEIFSH